MRRYVQGCCFFKPMPAGDFEKLIDGPEKIDTGGFIFRAKEECHTREFLDENGKRFYGSVYNIKSFVSSATPIF